MSRLPCRKCDDLLNCVLASGISGNTEPVARPCRWLSEMRQPTPVRRPAGHPARRHAGRLTILLIVLAVVAGVGLKRHLAMPRTTESVLAPGLRLTEIVENRVTGPVHLFIVRAERGSGWRPHLAPAGQLAVDKAKVSVIGNRLQAPVAVNCTYFFYDGPAVGPLRIGGEWWCLPWSNRTALGIAPDGSVRIGPMTAKVHLMVGDLPLDIARLNGNPANQPDANVLSMLTPRYAPWYVLQPNQQGFAVSGDHVSQVGLTGQLDIPLDGYAVVADGGAVAQLATVALGQSVQKTTVTTPASWGSYPDIAGAGPRLVRGGAVLTTEVEEKFKPDVLRRGPRTAFGVDQSGDYILLVADGWQETFAGLTIAEEAVQMRALGAVDALSFDGGASTALAANGNLVNNPLGPAGETRVSDILFFDRK